MTLDVRSKMMLFLGLVGSIGVLGLVVGIAWSLSGFTPLAPFLAATGAALVLAVLILARKYGRR